MAETTEALEVIQPRDLATWTPRFALTVDEAVELVDQKREFMKRVMRENEHYGIILGTKGKPSLFKPGAELLLSSMGLHPRYRDTAPAIEDWTGAEHNGEPFFRYRRTCMITRSTGPGPEDYAVIAEAGGNCNSWEKKYRYRASDRMCPTCGKTGTVIKGKQEYGGGWLCFAKKGGCGAKFPYNDKRIMDQNVGDVPNPDIADLVNTLEKMADKRALVAATLLATGCSDIFTQDLEDGVGSADSERAPAVDQDGVIANPSVASREAVQANMGMEAAPSVGGPTPTAAVATPPAPSVNQGRSVGPSGPRAKRSNVVAAPQAVGEAVIHTRPVAPDGPTVAPSTPASLPPETPAMAADARKGFSYRNHGRQELLSNAQPLDAPLDGEAEYLDRLRMEAREVAAIVVHLRVKLTNKKNAAEIALGNVQAQEIPSIVPSATSDASLTKYIADTYGKTLADLTEAELDGTEERPGVLRTLQGIVDRIEKSGVKVG